MLFESLNRRYVGIIKSGAARNASKIVESVKEDASQPASLPTDGPLRRAYYEGKHAEAFKRYLRQVYPRAMEKKEIHPVTVNYVRTWAETDADIYRNGQPQRIGASEAETERLQQLAQAARLDTILPDTEVKAHVGRQIFLKVLRNPKTDRLEVTRHWPHDVWGVEDPAAPSVLEQCPVVMIRIAHDIFELWTSSQVNGKKAWNAQQIHLDEENPRIVDLFDQPYFGRLPICAMTVGPTEASIYLDDDADLIGLANNHMLAWTDIFHTVRMQGHNPIYVSTASDTATIEAGPGGVTQLGIEDRMGAIQVNPQIQESRDLIGDFTGAIARSRSQSPRAYSTTPTALNSGLALRVDNRITEEKRPQRVALMAEFEREHLLPILDEVDHLIPPRNQANAITPSTPLTSIEVIFPKPQIVEDMAQRQNRLQHAQEMGWISPARAATEAGFYESVEHAEREIAKLDPPPTPEEVPQVNQAIEAPARGPTPDGD